MTDQVPEIVLFEGVEHGLYTDPLDTYFTATGQSVPDFKGPTGCESSCCWRGYVGHWDIAAGQLRLLDLQRFDLDSEGPVSILSLVFPDARPPLPASWYSGDLRLQKGKVLRWEYAPVFEEEIVVTVRDGAVTNIVRVDNRQASGEQPMPSRVDVMDLGTCACGGRLVPCDDADSAARCESCGRMSGSTRADGPAGDDVPVDEPGEVSDDSRSAEAPHEEPRAPQAPPWAWIYEVDPIALGVGVTWVACMLFGTGAGAGIGAAAVVLLALQPSELDGRFDWSRPVLYLVGAMLSAFIHLLLSES